MESRVTNQHFYCPSGLIHVEWLEAHIGIVRLFNTPIGQLEEETGQPWQTWNWSCVVHLEGKWMTVKAVHSMPDLRFVWDMLEAASSIGMEVVLWERWKNGRKMLRRYNLPLNGRWERNIRSGTPSAFDSPAEE